MVKTSPARTVWLGLAAFARLTRTLPSWTSCAARVRDLVTRANQSHLSSRWVSAGSSSCVVAGHGPGQSWLRFSRAALSELSAANGESGSKAAFGVDGEACSMGRGRSSRRLGTLAAVIAAPERTLALASHGVGRRALHAWLAFGGHVRRPCDARGAARFSRSGRSKARPLRRGRQISSHFSSAGSGVGGGDASARPPAAAASTWLVAALPSRGATAIGGSVAPFRGDRLPPAAAAVGWRRRRDRLGRRRLRSDLGRGQPALGPKAQRLQHVPELSAEQPRIDIISGVALKPPSPVAPFGGALGLAASGRQASSGRMRSASRSSMSTRTARGPQTWKPATR